jgi:hypothetical protein
MAWRFVWFAFGVLPGNILIHAHSRMLAARGRPQAALFPITFYRIVGFVLITMCFSLINQVLPSLDN